MGVVQARTGKVFVKSPRRRRGPLDIAKAHEIVWADVAPVFEAGALFADTLYVYFIAEEDGGAVKIGSAKDPIKRLREMQTGNPRRLRVELVILGDRDLERLLHQYWEDFAIYAADTRGRVGAPPNTEWFRPEIREKLFPIIAHAAKAQVEVLKRDGASEGFSTNAVQLVRDAHIAHGFIAKGRDETILLAHGAGYVRRGRRSRI